MDLESKTTKTTTIRPDDVGFQIMGDVFRKRLKPVFHQASAFPLFRHNTPKCVARPRILSQVPNVAWDAFGRDTTGILDRQARLLLARALALLGLMIAPLYLVPGVQVAPFFFLTNDAGTTTTTMTTTQEEPSNSNESEEDDTSTVLWYFLYLMVLQGMFLSLLCFVPQRSYQELEHVQKRYSADFFHAGIELMLVRDGRTAVYWIFRPIPVESRIAQLRTLQ